ncbi:MAG: transposase [Candidatus Aminicenantales bacterium]
MAGVYRPRHPERAVLYRVLFPHFEKFVAEYEERFERTSGYFRPIVKDVVERYLDCGNPRCGFARSRCRAEHLLMFSCKTRGFCLLPCQAVGGMERVDAGDALSGRAPHRQVVFTIPKMLLVFFKFKRRLLGDLCRIRTVLSLERLAFLEPEGKVRYLYGQDARDQETMDYLEFIARVTSHIPDKRQVMVRYYGLYANAHRGKVQKALVPFALRMAEEDKKRIHFKGWVAMIRKVYEVDPLICPRCGGRMKVVAFLTSYTVVDRIMEHLKLTFVAEKPPSAHVFTQAILIESDERTEYS